MKPAPFDYRAPSALEEALDALKGGEAKIVAGSQSLGPMLNLRLARPSSLIDVAALPKLRESRETDEGAEIGAAVTHAEIEDGETPDPTGGWLRAAAANIAHRAVRNRGTLGGSLAHADPAADWVIVMTGLGATVRAEGPSGRRDIPMEEFVTGPFSTALRQGEAIVSVFVPRPAPGARWGYWKFVRQVGEFAKASATVLIDPRLDSPRIALGALGGPPVCLSPATATGVVDGNLTAAQALAEALPDRASADRALHVAALARALEKAAEQGERS